MFERREAERESEISFLSKNEGRSVKSWAEEAGKTPFLVCLQNCRALLTGKKDAALSSCVFCM